MRWLRRRAEPSTEDLMALAREHAKAERYDDALAIWEPLARAGHARACNNIGACFAEGMGVERDPLMAERWLAPAAEAGDPVAQRNLATMLFKGEGIEPDRHRALALYLMASEQGDAISQDMLSWMLLEDEAVPADHAEARRWAERAAAQGVSLTILPGMSFVEVLYTRLGIDPVAGLAILDAEDVARLAVRRLAGVARQQVAVAAHGVGMRGAVLGRLALGGFLLGALFHRQDRRVHGLQRTVLVEHALLLGGTARDGPIGGDLAALIIDARVDTG